MTERLRQIFSQTSQTIEEKVYPDNGDFKHIEGVVDSLLEMISSKDFVPEECIRSVRSIWGGYYAGEFTVDQRIWGLNRLIGGFPEKVVEELTKPIGPKGETRLMQIAAEEEKEAKAAKARKAKRKRLPKGVRKHTREKKAEARRRGESPPKF